MSSAVNAPTNTKIKEQDVNQKLQLYGIYSAFANGKVPSNRQIDIALNSFLASKPLTSPSNRLSSDGKQLVADFRDVVEKAKLLLLTKNEGNVLQDFIWQSQQLSGGNAKVPSAPVDKATAQQHGNQALDGLRTLGALILSNGQFRKLLSDVTILLRDMAGDAAQTAASRINPSEDQLTQIDRPAEDNTWHEVPSVAELKGQAKDMYGKNKPFSKQDVQGAAGDATQAAHPTGARDPVDTAAIAAQDQHYGTSSGVDAQSGAQVAANNLQANAKENVPQETQDNATELAKTTRLQTRNYLNKKVPKERREQTIWRLKKMVVEIQGHEDYQQAIETLLTLAETYGGHGRSLGQQSTETVQGAHADDALRTAEADLLTLIERFANSTSSDDLWESFNNIYQDAQKDPELKNWFKSVDAYIRKFLQQAGYIMQDESTDEGNRLYDQGQFLLRERYRDHTNRVLDEFKFMATQFDEDPQNKAFAASMEKLFNDLGNDENGKPVFKKHLVKDLSTVILPAAFENIRYVPIPRIEYSDPQIDAIVENLVIESDNLMPNSFEITSDNYFRWGRKTVASKSKNKIEIAVSGIQMDLRDVSYYIKKKEGFPSVTDKGVMDIFMGGEGFSFKAGLVTADKSDTQHFFKVTTIKVDIKNLKLKMKQSNHKLLFNVAKPLLLRVVRPALQKVIQKQIKDTITRGDAMAYEINVEANRALEDAKANPENAANIYQRYLNAVQKKIAEGKQTADKVKAKADNTQANVAMTQHDSIFKDIKLPGGISTKATEYKDLAAKGEKWESPVFGIGSAKESANIPKVAEITRKPHTTATSAVHRTNASYGSVSQTEYSNQISQAFDGNANPGLKTTNGSTTLGANNPVVSGVGVLQWGYPLLAYVQLVQPLLASIGSNKLFNSRALSSADGTPTVVRPNVDTVYSVAAIDLSQGDVEVTVPPVPDGRFYVFPFYDLYGNNFANIGSANNSRPGKYLLRRKERDHGLEIPYYRHSQYEGFVNFPTTYGSLLLRILLLNNGSDINVVNSIQNQTRLSVVQRRNESKSNAPKLSTQLLETSLPAHAADIPPSALNESVTTSLLNLTARLYPFNPPEHTPSIPRITALLSKAGLHDGQYTPPNPPQPNPSPPTRQRHRGSSPSRPPTSHSAATGSPPAPAISGNFHSAFAFCAFIAYSGYLELETYEAIYPAYVGFSSSSSSSSNDTTTGVNNSLPVPANDAILFTFSGKPPVKGFWSLTVYGEDGELVPNPLHVYSLGDRSNLTYPDGRKIYGQGNGTAGRDGTFQLLMQPADKVPPRASWTANWLPVPSGGGSFQVNLRYYGAEAEMLDAEYVQPVVTAQEAIV